MFSSLQSIICALLYILRAILICPLRSFLKFSNSLIAKQSAIWDQQKDALWLWSNERSICSLVEKCFYDCLNASQLNNYLFLQPELSFFNLRPDLFIILNKEFSPVGCIEVKSPSTSRSPLENQYVIG